MIDQLKELNNNPLSSLRKTINLYKTDIEELISLDNSSINEELKELIEEIKISEKIYSLLSEVGIENI